MSLSRDIIINRLQSRHMILILFALIPVTSDCPRSFSTQPPCPSPTSTVVITSTSTPQPTSTPSQEPQDPTAAIAAVVLVMTIMIVIAITVSVIIGITVAKKRTKSFAITRKNLHLGIANRLYGNGIHSYLF